MKFIILALLLLPLSVNANGLYLKAGIGLHGGFVAGQDWDGQYRYGTHYGIGCIWELPNLDIDFSRTHASQIFEGSPVNNLPEDRFERLGVEFRFYIWR